MMQTEILLVDDLDGGEANETVTFALDGVNYAIDLSTDNAQSFRDLLAVHVDAARVVEAEPEAPARKSTTDPMAAQIRAWAAENGYEVAERGRIANAIREAYEAATAGGEPVEDVADATDEDGPSDEDLALIESEDEALALA